MPTEIGGGGNHFNRISSNSGSGLELTTGSQPQSPRSRAESRGARPEGMPGFRVGGSARGASSYRAPLERLQRESQANLTSDLESSNAMQREVGYLQAAAGLQSFMISSAQQQANSSLHMAQVASETAVKIANKGADAAKEAAG